VGVMPEGFTFPQNHGAWMPLHFSAVDAVPGAGPTLLVFGRLAEGATLEAAKAEITAIGERNAVDHPDTYAQATAQMAPFASRIEGNETFVTAMFYALRVLLVLLLAVPCINVATLVFARTVTREGEIAVRMSLGATRRRIVVQLFAEALVLVMGSTLVALFLARWALGRVAELFFIIQQEPSVPFGWDEKLSVPTILYAGVLALAGAVMVGVVPALKATHGAVQPKLSELSTGTISRLRFGGMWTAIIVAQVALSVAFLPIAVSQFSTIGALENPGQDSTFPASEYVTAQLGRDAVLPPEGAEARAEFFEVSRQLFDEVKTRLAADPRVDEVAFASGLSAMNHVITPIEFVGDGSSPPTSAGVRTLLVEPAYLEMMGATVVAGRGLQSADLAPGSRTVVVNQAFVDVVLAGRNAVGGQVRYPERSGESQGVVQVPEVGQSYEVVGVVANPGVDEFGPGPHPAVYAPLTLAPVTPRAVGLVGMPPAPAVQMFVHLRPGAEPITTLMYDVAGSVDPTLRVSELFTVEDAWSPVHQGARLGGLIFMMVAGVVLMLSAAGIYALMSFTVSQRTREIAIRQAVGATPNRILRSVFTRSFLQLGLGVAVGLAIALPVALDSAEGTRNALIAASLLVVTGLGSCLIPIRRALRIQPASAVKTG
jgi:putative ABC transport system permease protein